MIAARLVLLAAAALTACSFQNPNEREADRMTRAVMENDLRPVQNDIEKDAAITRVKITQWSAELRAQGRLVSIEETRENCPRDWHCFDVTFARREYLEAMRFDDNHKVVDWDFHMASR